MWNDKIFVIENDKTIWFLLNRYTYRPLFCFYSISTERHRAEVRRAVNDEKLATIAEK